MQFKEVCRRAGLVLLNLTYGTFNIVKSLLLGGFIAGKTAAQHMWESSNHLTKLATPFAMIFFGIAGAIVGFAAGIRDFFINFKNTIVEGNYKTSLSFEKTFGIKALEFKYQEEIVTTSPDKTPTTPREVILHDISL